MSNLELNKLHYMLFVAGTLAGGGIGVLATKAYFKNKYEVIADMEVEKVKENLRSRLRSEKNDKNEEHLISIPEVDTWTLSPAEIEEERSNYDEVLADLPYSSIVTMHGEKPSIAQLIAVRESLDTVEEKEFEINIAEKVVSGELGILDAKNIFDSVDDAEAAVRLLNNVFSGRMESPTEDEDDDEDDDEDNDEESPEYQEGLRLTQQQESHKGPRVISLDEWTTENTHYSKISLAYYEEDNVLCEDSDEVIEDIDSCIGLGALDCFGQDSGDKNVVFIRNDDVSCDYEVERTKGSFVENVLGYVEPKEAQKIRRMRSTDA